MKFEYGKAPIKYTNGVPSHLAGEWPGITSCKFHSYLLCCFIYKMNTIHLSEIFIYYYIVYNIFQVVATVMQRNS